MSDDNLVEMRLSEVQDNVAKAAQDVGREANAVQLIAVSKTFGAEAIGPVLQAGHRVFGENRVQEALGKWPDLKARYGDVDLHLIGPLQSNKARDAVGLFDAIHSIDRPKIAKAVAAEMARTGRQVKLFVQVNTGEEPQKAGVILDDVDGFVKACQDDYGLTISGLMCIPPFDEEPSLHFALLKKIADRLGLAELSMGMSGDYETAVQFGATHVRVGSAIFGERGK